MVSIDVSVKETLGDILLVKLEKEKFLFNDQWYCRCISVKTPSGYEIEFPCYRWIANKQEVVLRDGKGESYSLHYPVLKEACHKYCRVCVCVLLARLPQDEKNSLLKEHRRMELESRQQLFRFDAAVTILENIQSFGGVNVVFIFPKMIQLAVCLF